MKTAKELYPDYWKEEQEDGSFYGPGNYQPIINEIGNVLVQVDDQDYQGDSRVLYEKDGKFGYLIFGWGSCSGCDALQGCSTVSDIQELIDKLSRSVVWYDSLAELKQYFNEKDWELEYCWHADETKEFITNVLNYNN
jgi:hypothetical protein